MIIYFVIRNKNLILFKHFTIINFKILIIDVLTALNGIAMIERGMQSYPNLESSVLAFSAGWDTCFFLACMQNINVLLTNDCFM